MEQYAGAYRQQVDISSQPRNAEVLLPDGASALLLHSQQHSAIFADRPTRLNNLHIRLSL